MAAENSVVRIFPSAILLTVFLFALSMAASGARAAEANTEDFDFRAFLAAVKAEPDLEDKLRLAKKTLQTPGIDDRQLSAVHGLLGAYNFEAALEAQRMADEATVSGRRPLGSAPEDRLASISEHLHASVQHYTSALALYRNSPMRRSNHWNRGYSYELLGKLDAALQDYDQVLELKPDFVMAYVYRARILAAQGHRDRALANLEEATRLAPDDHRIAEVLRRYRSAHVEQ